MNHLMRLMISRALRAPEGEGGDGGSGGDEGETRPTPAELNQEANNRRLNRMSAIARNAEARRSSQMRDSDGERVVGPFQGGEFDDDPEAREREQEIADQEAEEALDEQRRRAAEEEASGQARARALQEEGGLENEGDEDAGPGGEQNGDGSRGSGAGEVDEKVVGGVRYYRTMVAGVEKWLSLSQLRESAGMNQNAAAALQQAQEALQRSAQAQLAPRESEAETLSDEDLENVVLSASMGDQEAVKKLVSVLKARPQALDATALSRQVSQQIATTRTIEQAEDAQKDVLGNPKLAPVFRLKLTQLAQAEPTLKIRDAYQRIGDEMRRDFAPMLQSSGAPPSKADRKRTLVTPPQSAGRQPQRRDNEQEEPVGSVIDRMAQARGQNRAIRQGRR